MGAAASVDSAASWSEKDVAERVARLGKAFEGYSDRHKPACIGNAPNCYRQCPQGCSFVFLGSLRANWNETGAKARAFGA